MVNLIPAASYLTANHTNINLWLSFNNVNNKARLSKITKQKMWSWDHQRHPPPLYPGSYSVFCFDSRLSGVFYPIYFLSFTLISCVLLLWSVQSPRLVLSMSVHIFVLCLVSIYLYCRCKTAFLDFPVCLYSWFCSLVVDLRIWLVSSLASLPGNPAFESISSLPVAAPWLCLEMMPIKTHEHHQWQAVALVESNALLYLHVTQLAGTCVCAKHHYVKLKACWC